MKKFNLKKNNFFKKFFIKLNRKLGYEIIDQGNFFVPTQNKFINGEEQNIIKNKDNKFNLFRIGDAVSSRNIHAAIYDALRLVINL